MTGHFSSARTLCIHNENAQCNPIWLAQSNGLKLAHYRTSGHEVGQIDDPRRDVCTESCERGCVHMGHSSDETQI